MKDTNIDKLSSYLDHELSPEESEQMSSYLKENPDQLDLAVQVVKSSVYMDSDHDMLILSYDKLAEIVDFITKGKIELNRQESLMVRFDKNDIKKYSFVYHHLNLFFFPRGAEHWDLVILSDIPLIEKIELIREESVDLYDCCNGECIIPLEWDQQYLLSVSTIPPLTITLKTDYIQENPKESNKKNDQANKKEES